MVVFPRTTTTQSTLLPADMQKNSLPPVGISQAQKQPNCQRNWARQSLGGIVLGLLLTLSIVTTTFAQSCPLYPSPHQRIGFNVAPDEGIDIHNYDAAQLGAGWYHNYSTRQSPYHPGGIQFHQMIRASIDRSKLPQLLGQKVLSNPGALWILGNEPDRYGQDGLTPAQYATFYHDIYTYLRATDPTSRIAIAGIVQPTPIRLRYLDMVLASYQQQYSTPMPVEIWDIHNFILPENCSWGASIPPGLGAYLSEGVACPATLDDHGDITIFKNQIRVFRQWMKDRGFRDTPLIVSEYGILLSKYHGYDYARVSDYMRSSFDYMLNTTDAQIGYPADGNRLVQEFAWFSLNYWEFDLKTNFGLNGNLFDHDSAQITPLGRDFAAYTNAVTVRTIDLAIRDIQLSATTIDVNTPVTINTAFANLGGIAAENVTVQIWDGNPNTGGTLLDTSAVESLVGNNCHTPRQVSYQWQPTVPGVHTIYVNLTASNLDREVNLNNNYATLAVTVKGDTPPVTPTATATPGGPTATPTMIPTAPTATQTPTLIPTTLVATPTATLIPATPTPTINPTTTPNSESTVLVDSLQSGTLTITTADGAQIHVSIPAGAVDQPTTLILRAVTTLPTTARNLAFTGRAFVLEAYQNGSPATSLHFATPIILVVDYLDSDLEELEENELMIYTINDSTVDWESGAITLINHDQVENQLVVSYNDDDRSATATRTFALFAPAAPTAIATPTPVPTPTSTPPISQLNQHLYLPLITNN